MGLALVMALAGLTISGMLFLPSLVSKTTQRMNTAEEIVLNRLEENFRDYVRLYQAIPGTGTWATAIAFVGSLNASQISSTFPEFPADNTVQRAFVVDDLLGGASPLLPYTQSTNGLTGTLTNLLSARARAMIISSTKRGLALPVTSGFLTQSSFDAIWNWASNPATKAPPAGWSSAWTRNGEFLHVKPIYLPSLFSKITFQNAKFGLGMSNTVTTAVSASADYHFLNGTPMTLATPPGVIKQDLVVRRDASFDFGSTSAPPLLWFRMDETSGTTATNFGTADTAGTGTGTSGVVNSQPGPRPSSFPNYSASNSSKDFDSRKDYIATGYSLSNLKGFTLGCWVWVDSVTSRTGLIGQNDAIEMGFSSPGVAHIWTPNGGSLSVSWPYANGTWHHMAATGNGTALRLYFDGAEVSVTYVTTSNYGDSGYTFYAGGGTVFDAPVSTSVFDGKMDEIVVYDRALSAGEVSQLATGLLP